MLPYREKITEALRKLFGDEPREAEVEMFATIVESEVDHLIRKLDMSGKIRSGRARMAMLTPEERSALGKKASAARWGKK